LNYHHLMTACTFIDVTHKQAEGPLLHLQDLLQQAVVPQLHPHDLPRSSARAQARAIDRVATPKDAELKSENHRSLLLKLKRSALTTTQEANRVMKARRMCQRQGLNRISVLKNGGFSTELTLLLKHCASREGSTMEGLGGSSKGSL
jgi:hypothetical protein